MARTGSSSSSVAPASAKYIAYEQHCIILPPLEHRDERPVKGILHVSKDKSLDDPAPIYEGVAPFKAPENDIPPTGRLSLTIRKLVSPEALELGKERFEAANDSVIVHRLLWKEDIQGYADATGETRSKHEESHEKTRVSKSASTQDTESEVERRERRIERRDLEISERLKCYGRRPKRYLTFDKLRLSNSDNGGERTARIKGIKGDSSVDKESLTLEPIRPSPPSLRTRWPTLPPR